MRTLEFWQAGQLEVGQVVKLYYPDTRTGKPVIRQGKILQKGDDSVTVETSRGPRTLKFARMQGTLTILEG